MWTKIKQVLKNWGWAIFLGLAWLIGGRQSQKWLREKEKEVKERDKEIGQATGEAADSKEDYERVKADHDESIQEAQEGEDKPSFTNPDDAASFIDDLIGKGKR